MFLVFPFFGRYNKPITDFWNERNFYMKVFIMTDLEGVSCAGSERLWDRANPEYADACKRLMADLNAAVRASFDAGADAVSVYDGHGGGGNFIEGALDPRAKHETSYDPDIFADCEAFVIVGGHAKAGTMTAFLDHTQSSSNWFEYTVNGVPHGELGQDAAYCGAYGIPVVALAGDKAACVEAADLIPGIECAAVKTATGRYHADCLPADEAERLIYEAVLRGVTKRAEIPVFTFDLPAEIRVTYTYTHVCEETMRWNKNVTRVDGRTVTRTVREIRTFNDVLP